MIYKHNKSGYPTRDRIHYRGTSYSERHPFIPSISISNVIDILNLFRQDEYVIDCQELRVTHRKLKRDAIIISKALFQLGVRSGDIVTVCMPNLYQAVAIFKAANRIGAVTTFLNPLGSVEELKAYIDMYHSPVLFHYNTDNRVNEDILENTCVGKIITLDLNNTNRNDFNREGSINGDVIDYYDLSIIASECNGIFKTWFGGAQDALILYTSGSTGEPKSLLFTNSNILSALIYLRNSTHQPKLKGVNNRWMGVVPIMYPYGFVCSVLASILNNCEVIMAPDMSPEKIAYYYGKKPSLVFGSPAFLEVTRRNLPDEIDCSELKQFVSGGDFLSESQSREGIEFFKKHNAKTIICNGSGNGELLGCCTNSMNVPYKPDTVGQLILGPEYVVVNDDTGEEVRYGEQGVLLVRGKNVFKGYYGRNDLTQEVMTTYKGKQYYRTGNYGYLDEDRYFHMVGRASRFFIVYTLNKVYCELVQNVVSSIEEVESCAVVPQPDKDMLFVSKAYVVLKQGYTASHEMEKKIIEASRRTITDSTGQEVTLKDYEIPKSVTFLDSLPRTQADKIDYELMKKMAEEEVKEVR